MNRLFRAKALRCGCVAKCREHRGRCGYRDEPRYREPLPSQRHPRIV